MNEGFMFANADAAMEFYELCESLGAITMQERMAILRLMVKDKKVKYLRDGEDFIKGKNVLKIGSERKDSNA
jgi:hypothetical protein